MTDLPTIGFAGMTHLGIVSSVAAAERGFQVVCFDADPALITRLQSGDFPVHEPDLKDAGSRNAKRLRYTSSLEDLRGISLCFIASDVPTDDAGRSDLEPVRGLISKVDSALSNEATMVVLSQVSPGFTRSLSRSLDRRFYQVETLVFGQALGRAISPERFIVGCAKPEKALPLAYARYLQAFGCKVLQMGYESAELAKIAINLFLVSSVSTTNTVAEICERIGADWSEIAPALRLDRRIGPYAYLAPGLGIAGGNLERDLAAVIALGEREETDVGVVKAWVSNSHRRRDWAFHILADLMQGREQGLSIGLLGLAYKQDTSSTKNSPALALLAALPDSCTIRAFDPMVKADPAWHKGLQQVDDAMGVCLGADALVIMTPWPEFSNLAPRDIAESLNGRVVIDPYGVLDSHECLTLKLSYFRLGSGQKGRVE